MGEGSTSADASGNIPDEDDDDDEREEQHSGTVVHMSYFTISHAHSAHS